MKKIIIIILTVILLTGCTNKTEKLYLSDEYYNNGSFITYTSEDYKLKLNANFVDDYYTFTVEEL